MNLYIVIREVRTNDKIKCDELIQHGIMSTLSIAFWAAITREITFQLIVLTAAILFIFFGIPFSFCIGAVPLVMVLVYFSIYGGHWMKVIDQNGMRAMHGWVAEAYEPHFFMEKPKSVAYTLLTEKEANSRNIDAGSYQRKLVGLVCVDRHRNRHYSAWVHSLVVERSYRRKGIGAALICAVINYCEEESYETVECATTECQEAARQVFLNAGFQMIQMYHKKLTVISLEKYLLGIQFKQPS